MFEEKRQLLDHDSASNKDRCFDSQTAQINPLFHKSDAKVIDIWFDEFGNAFHAMTIGIGFEHRHDLCRRNVRTNGFDVSFELIEIDFKIGWTHYFLYQ